ITSAGWMESMLFRGFQLVVLWRVGTEVLAGLGYSTAGLLWISGLGWLAVFGVWFARFGRVLTRPRVDGQPG
ncbi:MAG: NnrS family protein, partial [Deltaproteobacteria bacterium]|nr:NnrS family protein [Deltaproteobacteria bacterium]